MVTIQEKVTDYSVVTLRNDIVAYRRVIRLTTETGHRAFLAFPEHPPADWLRFPEGSSNVFLERDEFDRVYHLLQSEAPVYYTAFNVIGIRAFNLSTAQELPGEGPADDNSLAEVAAEARTAARAASL